MFENPENILHIVKKIIPNTLKKNHLYNEITKKDFSAYIYARYKNMGFANKIIKFFYPSGSKEKMKYLDYFYAINIMLKWTRTEQIGFCFHLFDANNDGFICIRDMFELMS